MKPWLSDPELDDDLRDMLESATQDEPDDASVERLAAALGPLLDPPGGGGGGGGTGGEAAPPPQGTATSTYVAAGAVVVLAIGALFFGDALGGAALDGAATQGPVPVPVPLPVPESMPVPAPATAHAPDPAPEPQPATQPDLAPQPATQPDLGPASDLAPAMANGAPPAPNDLAAEAALIRSMRTSLEGNPAQTLGLSRRHRLEHPRGDLAEERDVLVIEAHSRLGHDARFRRLAARFLAQNPSSTHAARVRSLLE